MSHPTSISGALVVFIHNIVWLGKLGQEGGWGGGVIRDGRRRPAPGANSRQLDHTSSREGGYQEAALPQSPAEAQPQDKKAERRS